MANIEIRDGDVAEKYLKASGTGTSGDPFIPENTTTLLAGTASIGKLGANSGVDIGDVDVLSVITGTGATNLGKAVDSAAGATDTGVATLAIRDDALTTLTPIDGDYTPSRVNARGAKWVAVEDGAGGQITSFKSTQYADGASVATPTGTQALWNEAGIERAVSLSKAFPVQPGTGITFAATQSGTWNITNISGTVSLPTGAATSAKQDTGNTSLASIDGKITACNTGNITVSSSALPTGAATAAKQPALGTAGTPSADVLTIQGITGMTALKVDGSAVTQPVSDGGGSLTVDGTVAATQSGTWSSRLTDGTTTAEVVPLTNYNGLAVAIVDGAGSQITSFGGGTQYTEGDTDASITGTAMLWEDTGDALRAVSAATPLPVNIISGAGSGGTAMTDDSAFTVASTSITPAGGVYKSVRDSVDDGDAGAFAMTANRALYVEMNSNPAVTQSGTWNITNVSGTVSLPTGAATESTLSTLNGKVTACNTGNVTIGAAIPAGDNNIGNVDVVTLPGVAGDVVHDSADSGNPIKIGGIAKSAEQTAVANNDRVNFVADLTGKQIILPYANPENLVTGATSDITGTTSTSVIAAAGAGVRNYITSLTIMNSHATVGTWVNITDGSGGTVLYTCYAAALGGGASPVLNTPLKTTANTALHAVCGTTGANVRVSASGYKGV